MNYKQIQALLKQAREQFLPYEGVLGVGYGTKQRGGVDTQEPSIIIFVESKLPADGVNTGEMIPDRFADLPTDVQVVSFKERQEGQGATDESHEQSIGEYLDWGKIERLRLQQRDQERDARRRKPSQASRRDTPKDKKAPVTETRGNLFVIEDKDQTLTYTTSAGAKLVSLAGMWTLFQATFGDDYDFAVFFIDDTDPNLPSPGYSFSNTVYRPNSDNGYGASGVDDRSSWNSTKRLQHFTYHTFYSARTLLHEIGHRWLFYINYRDSANGPERDLLHQDWESGWSAGQQEFHPGTWLDNDRSCMDYDHLDWIEVQSGVYRRISIADVDFEFCPLDQYLMGFLHPQAIASSNTTPPAYPTSGGNISIIQNPQQRTDGDFNATPVTITTQNIIWNEGTRSPDHLNSQRVFHQAIIVYTTDRSKSATFLSDSETRRTNHTKNWRKATSGRSVIDTSLLRTNASDLYIRDNINDTGTPGSKHPFCNSPDLFVRTSDDDPSLFLAPNLTDTVHQKPRSNQDNWVYARIHNKSATTYQDVVVNFYIANYHGFSGHDTVAQAVPRTEVIYPIDWHPDGLIGSCVLNAVPAKGTAVAKVRWEASKIPNATWHPCLLTEIIPLQTDPDLLKLHRVWDDRKLGQKNLQIEYVPTDSIYEFVLPLSVGHLVSPEPIGLLELVVDSDLIGTEILLEPGTALGELHQVGETLVHTIPGLSQLSSVQIQSLQQIYGSVMGHEGFELNIPRNTMVGLRYAGQVGVPVRETRVRFQRDTQLMIEQTGVDYLQMGLLPVEGFTLAEHQTQSVLRMAQVQRGRFPFSQLQTPQHEMNLTVQVDGRTLNGPRMMHIEQRDLTGQIVGGIDIEFRPLPRS